MLLALLANSSYADAPSGLFLNALTNPKFPVKAAASVLTASPRPAFGFVYKSYGDQNSNIKLLISDILAVKPTVHVIVYGDCGPCRPPRRPRGLFPLIAPSENIASLNYKLSTGNRQVLETYNREWTKLEKALPIEQGVTYVFEESLEDNLTDSSWAVLHSLSRQIFAGRQDVTFARNPLRLGSYHGSLEVHTYSLGATSRLVSGDIVNGDGNNLCLGDKGCTGLGQSQIRAWILLARSKGVTSLIYRADMQGLPIGSGNALIPVSPFRRKYTISQPGKLRELLS